MFFGASGDSAREITTATKIRVFNTNVKSVLLYGTVLLNILTHNSRYAANQNFFKPSVRTKRPFYG